MATRGRPTGSIVRDNVAEILYVKGKTTGYDVAKLYNKIFPPVTMRVIYYHLKKGVSIGIFKVAAVQKEEGDYSWGQHAEKIYYELTSQAKPRADERVREFLDKR